MVVLIHSRGVRVYGRDLGQAAVSKLRRCTVLQVRPLAGGFAVCTVKLDEGGYEKGEPILLAWFSCETDAEHVAGQLAGEKMAVAGGAAFFVPWGTRKARAIGSKGRRATIGQHDGMDQVMGYVPRGDDRRRHAAGKKKETSACR